MKQTLLALAVLFTLAIPSAAQGKSQHVVSSAVSTQVEARVRKLWDAFKKKDKVTLAAMLDDGFRQFEEGQTTFGDKKAEVNAVDEFELISYTLTDFTVKPMTPNTALVTYIAQYEGKSGGEVSKAKSVFAEVWIRSGNEWKTFYMQETYMK